MLRSVSSHHKKIIRLFDVFFLYLIIVKGRISCIGKNVKYTGYMSFFRIKVSGWSEYEVICLASKYANYNQLYLQNTCFMFK